jgi:16S rRNA (adenine1518-N6/adenine1519-N6)-dimethyltransferase
MPPVSPVPPLPSMPPRGTRQWLRSAGIRPRRAWGQNFLVNARVVERILQRWDLEPGTGVVEIGAGAGSLTLPLLERGLAVVAIERDPALCDLLRLRVAAEAPQSQPRILAADVLTLDPAQACAGISPSRGWVLVGNLPYSQTTPILEWAGEHRARFRWNAFMVQREYGDRMLAGAGDPAYGSLSLWVAGRFRTAKEILVKPENFWPIPKVDSIVLRLTPWETPPVDVPDLAVLERVVRAAFSQRRKMLAQPLAQALGLPRARIEAALAAAGIDARRRAETCGLEEFAALTRALAPDLSNGPIGAA